MAVQNEGFTLNNALTLPVLSVAAGSVEESLAKGAGRRFDRLNVSAVGACR